MHLDGGGFSVSHGNHIFDDVIGEGVARRKILEAAHCIRNVRTTYIDMVGITKCIGLKECELEGRWRETRKGRENRQGKST